MYFDFASIDKIVQKHADFLVNESKELNWKVTNLHKRDYFDHFQNLVNENIFWTGNPDSFKVAACLIAALIEKKMLRFEVNDSMPQEIVLYNYRLALNVALEFLSTTEIHTYTANSWGDYVVEQTHPAVKLSFPIGIIEVEDIYTSMCKSLAYADLKAGMTSASSIAIILHLLYCLRSAEAKNENK